MNKTRSKIIPKVQTRDYCTALYTRVYYKIVHERQRGRRSQIPILVATSFSSLTQQDLQRYR